MSDFKVMVNSKENKIIVNMLNYIYKNDGNKKMYNKEDYMRYLFGSIINYRMIREIGVILDKEDSFDFSRCIRVEAYTVDNIDHFRIINDNRISNIYCILLNYICKVDKNRVIYDSFSRYKEYLFKKLGINYEYIKKIGVKDREEDEVEFKEFIKNYING